MADKRYSSVRMTKNVIPATIKNHPAFLTRIFALLPIACKSLVNRCLEALRFFTFRWSERTAGNMQYLEPKIEFSSGSSEALHTAAFGRGNV
jgi:hypothetical protein